MDIDKLCSTNPAASRRYVHDKFTRFNGVFYPKSVQERKCVEYYLAAEGPPDRQEVVDGVYQEVFKQLFPIEKAEAMSEAPRKRETGAWLKHKQEELAEARRTLGLLRDWKERQEYQMGEDFMLELRDAVSFLTDDLTAEEGLHTEFEAFRVASLTRTRVLGADSVDAEFDAMIGLKQNASLSFVAASDNFGRLNATLEESFRAGAWANGKAKAKMFELGLTAEMQLAVALGVQLEIKGDLSWTKGAVGLGLQGTADVFAGARGAGARGEGEFKFSVHALKGIEASLKAGAFAGFMAEASGTCTFSYHGQKLVSATGKAGVTFGVGAEFAASLKAPIFGPTEVSFSANATLLTGATTSTSVAINFGGIYLAGKSDFQRLMYLPTIARGYKMDLMTQEAENLFYLNKCIVRVTGHIEELEGTGLLLRAHAPGEALAPHDRLTGWTGASPWKLELQPPSTGTFLHGTGFPGPGPAEL